MLTSCVVSCACVPQSVTALNLVKSGSRVTVLIVLASLLYELGVEGPEFGLNEVRFDVILSVQ